ncbi:L-2-amino-thiazoline-4-carboxylic acid hydrolase [Rhizobium sp. 60-20]|uniref:L-2-amino-thiazoline-4-carboxylic acid hydrolase n=1 Tax=Rhizobium sp. 60-20 TaxID=1895819 RepID=UPI000925B94B|nr:L-2-amino-thiazoline-4-carboxylic acid hydrolase [Rhizobium sp. 60-20]MBN8949853.1 L-2-amino-thiazoline-4-carboxylic acid hydrolase [Rhizobium tropici]OJY62764.1 MAG: hypothetical protein BGP09_16935 [Rhizobium sp. 60-20]
MEATNFRRGFRELFLRALDHALGCPADSADIQSATTVEAAAVIERYRVDWNENCDPYNLEFTAFLIGAYRTLQRRMPPVSSRTIIEAALDLGFAWLTDKSRAGLDAAQDPFVMLTDISREREQRFFGTNFAFDRPRDDNAAYHLDVTRCWYVEICIAEGERALAPVFCSFDKAWFKAVNPGRDGFVFRRPTTIANGDDRCRFYFERIANSPRPGRS